MTAPLRIAIFVDRADWHARRLVAAFAKRDVEAVPVPMQACSFAIDGQGGVVIPGFEDALPDGVFVRCIPGGSFEQVTLRLGLLHALEALGVPLCNDARAVERCVDKSMTSFLMDRAGIATPPTWVCEQEARAAAIVEREAALGHRVVVKPLFGSQGKGLQLLDRAADLPPAEDVAGVYYLQRYVGSDGPGWRDWRVLVAADRVLTAMARHGKGWITNVKQGATCEAAEADGEMTALALAAVRAVGAGYAGVDVIRDRAGRYQVLEVNSMPAWSGIQSVSAVDVSQAIADGFLERLAAGPAWRPSAPRRAAGG